MDDKSIQTILPIQRIRLRSLIRCTSSFCSGRPPLCPFTPFSGCSSALRHLGKLTAGLLVCILSVLCWRWRNAPVATRQFSWALAWVASVTLAIIPKLAAYNQPLLIPALLVVLVHRESIFKAGLLPCALTREHSRACYGNGRQPPSSHSLHFWWEPHDFKQRRKCQSTLCTLCPCSRYWQ